MRKRRKGKGEVLAAALDFLRAWGVDLEELRSFQTFIVDASALTDSHSELLWLIQEGYVTGVFYLPVWVRAEMNKMASSGRLDMSQAGRRGLDNLATLENIAQVTVIEKKGRGRDKRKQLVDLAERHELRILTADPMMVEMAKENSVTALNTSKT